MKRVLIGTPLHSGACPAYVASLDGMTGECARRGWACRPLIQTGSLVPLLRNGIAAEFLFQTDADVLFFIDGDHGWNWTDAWSVLNATNHHPIVGGVYRKKPHRLSELPWSAIATAAKRDSAGNLQFVGQDLNFDFLPEDIDGEKGYVGPTDVVRDVNGFTISVDGGDRKLVRAAHLGTGFLAITRAALDTVLHFNDVELVNGGMPVFFNTPVKDGLFHGEDWFFSDLARKAGLELWLDTETRIEHYGSIAVVGDISTADRLTDYARKQARGVGASNRSSR